MIQFGNQINFVTVNIPEAFSETESSAKPAVAEPDFQGVFAIFQKTGHIVGLDL